MVPIRRGRAGGDQATRDFSNNDEQQATRFGVLINNAIDMLALGKEVLR